MLLRSFIFALIFIVHIAVAPQSAYGDSCTDSANIETWANLISTNIKKETKTYFKTLSKCLKNNKEAQLHVDALANALFLFIPKLAAEPNADQKKIKHFAKFVRKAFQTAARAGLPSAQHNYATLHNLEPNNSLRPLFKQDYNTFIYWTRKAAAQKEERALFNLATRFAIGLPENGIEQDLSKAYILYKHLQESPAYKTKLGSYKAYIESKQKELRTTLGIKKINELDKNWQNFDFSSLKAKKFRKK